MMTITPVDRYNEAFPQLAQLRLSGTKDIGHAARIILGAMNYRVITKVVDLFGETGR